MKRKNVFDRRKELINVISSPREIVLCEILKSLGYEEEKDFFRQYPFEDKYFLDIAFPKYKLCIEEDGGLHKYKKQRLVDKERDRFLAEKDWTTIRIPDIELKAQFYKFLIKGVISDICKKAK